VTGSVPNKGKYEDVGRYWHSNGKKPQKMFAPIECLDWNVKIDSSQDNRTSKTTPIKS
jgi:hypothetical protein